MRLLKFGQVEDYQPLERGSAFPQFYENGDRYYWWHSMDFSNRYWMNFIQWADIEWDAPGATRRDKAEACMMGGEL